ncbi:hypothetical protein F5Y06DRAFT_234565 [Hypoxylon sp. FL0890]|nr:hypothetical protein F5Y06DRAFT_234565 [Hypoxylon sp. FL0890]
MSSGKAWSPQEKICFLVQVVEHLSKGKVPYKEVNLPGRTEKSMTHTWNHLRAESTAFLQGQVDGQGATSIPKTKGGNKRVATESAATTAPRRGSRKRTQTGSYRDSLSDDDEDKIPVKKPRLSSDEKILPGSHDAGEDSDLTLTDATNDKAGRPSQGVKSSEENIKIEFDDEA